MTEAEMIEAMAQLKSERACMAMLLRRMIWHAERTKDDITLKALSDEASGLLRFFGLLGLQK